MCVFDFCELLIDWCQITKNTQTKQYTYIIYTCSNKIYMNTLFFYLIQNVLSILNATNLEDSPKRRRLSLSLSLRDSGIRVCIIHTQSNICMYIPTTEYTIMYNIHANAQNSTYSYLQTYSISFPIVQCAIDLLNNVAYTIHTDWLIVHLPVNLFVLTYFWGWTTELLRFGNPTMKNHWVKPSSLHYSTSLL